MNFAIRNCFLLLSVDIRLITNVIFRHAKLIEHSFQCFSINMTNIIYEFVSEYHYISRYCSERNSCHHSRVYNMTVATLTSYSSKCIRVPRGVCTDAMSGNVWHGSHDSL